MQGPGEKPMQLTPFHLAIPVKDLVSARNFYGNMLGCKEGRSEEDRVDFNFFGHHLVTHVEPEDASHVTSVVVSSGVPTPVRHFGVIVSQTEWDGIVARLKATGADFFSQPRVIHAGTVKEQSVVLVNDGAGNIVEFKAQDAAKIFATKA
jgi:extradiol dioxygenase family protein